MRVDEMEKFMKAKNIRLTDKIEMRDGVIFIGDTELEIDPRFMREYPFGVYKTFFAVGFKDQNNQMLGGHWLEFDAMHDMDKDWSQKEKREARVNITAAEAMKFYDLTKEVGLHNA